MHLKSLMVLVLVLFAIIPVAIAGSFAYTQSYSRVYETCKQDLEERMDYCLRTCEFYNKKVEKDELTKEEAISEIANLLVGLIQPDGTRDITKGLGKGKEGYVGSHYTNGTCAFHSTMKEGQSIYEVEDLTIKEVVTNYVMKAFNRDWHEYEWVDPITKESYSKVMALDYFKPFDLHLAVTATMDEFTYPLKLIRNVIILATIIAGVTGIAVSLFVARGIAKPFTKLSETSSKITKGDLSTRVDTKSPIEEFSSVSGCGTKLIAFYD
jgi:methyl-accepting chemotaxis protein